ncbi:MAG: hypothetical protein M1420_01860 [Actinobacteria bacterium]|jgi:hypothetical protein|nr:hypothetical protein [Actinomycetota bacterium]
MKMILDYLRLERECVLVDHILTERVAGMNIFAGGLTIAVVPVGSIMWEVTHGRS